MNGNLARLSRRGFLGASAVGLGVAGAAAGWFWFAGDEGSYRRALGGAVPVTLTVAELAILDALAGSVIAPAPTGPSVREAQTARRIDRELFFHAGSKLVSDVKLSLALIEWLPWLGLMGGKFSELKEADRLAFLKACESSRWSIRNQAFAGLKFLILFFYYSDDRTWPSIGYSGPQVAEKFYEGGNRIANLTPVESGRGVRS